MLLSYAMTNQWHRKSMRVLCYEDLVAKGIKYRRQHLSRLMSENKFPQKINLGEGRIAWLENEIDDWLKAKVDARNAAKKAP